MSAAIFAIQIMSQKIHANQMHQAPLANETVSLIAPLLLRIGLSVLMRYTTRAGSVVRRDAGREEKESALEASTSVGELGADGFSFSASSSAVGEEGES